MTLHHVQQQRTNNRRYLNVRVGQCYPASVMQSLRVTDASQLQLSVAFSGQRAAFWVLPAGAQAINENIFSFELHPEIFQVLVFLVSIQRVCSDMLFVL